MKTKHSIAIILVFSIMLSTFVPAYFAAAVAPIFTDNYETGGYSNWTNTAHSADSSMTVTTNTVLSGSYSADCTLGDSIETYAYTYYSLSSVPVLYHREYIRVLSLPPAGASTDLFGIMDVIGTGVNLATIGIQNDGSNYRWKLNYYNDGSPETAYSTDVQIKANTWYYVEMMVKEGSGTGQVTVWIAEDLTAVNQGSPTINLINLSNQDRPIGAIFFGGYVLGASYPVHIYSDEVVASTTWSGPRDYTSPTIGTITANSHSVGSTVTLSSTITDNVGIDTIIPSWNNSGTWTNQTAIDAHGSSSLAASFTSKWNTNPGTVVSVKYYAQDTSGNWGSSSIVNFTLNNYAVTLSANATNFVQDDTVGITATVTKNGAAFTTFLANVSKDNALFASNVSTSCTDKETLAKSHIYAVTSLYDSTNSENVTFTTNPLTVTWSKSTYSVTFTANQTSLVQGDTVNVNIAVSKSGAPFTNFLANITKDGVPFARNVTSSFTDLENTVTSHAYAISSLYDTATSENVTFTANPLSISWSASVYTVDLYVNQTSITQGTTATVYLNVTKNGLPYNGYTATISKDGSSFKSDITTSFTDTESAATVHKYNVTSLADTATGQTVTFTTGTLSVAWAQTPATTPTPTATPTAKPSTTPSPTPKASATPTPTATPTQSPSPTPTEMPPSGQGLSQGVLLGAIAAIVIIIVVMISLLFIRKRKTKKP